MWLVGHDIGVLRSSGQRGIKLPWEHEAVSAKQLLYFRRVRDSAHRSLWRATKEVNTSPTLETVTVQSERSQRLSKAIDAFALTTSEMILARFNQVAILPPK
jgi:hypothetical protein